MAVGNQPNDVYLAETLLAEFKNISRGNGYYTDVQDALMPSWNLTDESYNTFVINPKVTGHDKLPALFMWVDRSIPDEGFTGMAERALHVIVCGVVKQEEGLQLALMRFANDVRGVMLFNQSRVFPGGTAQDTGASTREMGDGIGFNIVKNETSNSVGYFVSFWAVSHKFPSPRG